MNRSALLLIVFLVALPLASGWVIDAEPWLAPAIADSDEAEPEVKISEEALSATRHRSSPVGAVNAARSRARPPRRLERSGRAPAPPPSLTASPLRC
jgi:hypothetical protein